MIDYRQLTYELAEAHIDELVKIEEDTLAMFGNSFDTAPWQANHFLAHRDKKGMLSCCAMSEGRVCAYSVAYEFCDKFAHISRLVVHPGYLGKGIGEALLKFQLELFPGYGIESCSIDLVKQNAAALRLYTRNGFRLIEGEELESYVKLKERHPEEYLGENATHIALIKRYEKV